MKTLEKKRAISLRKQGKTFGEISEEISVSQGSLSHWLKDISLTKEQLARIQYKNDKIKDKFIKYNVLKKRLAEDRKKVIENNAVKEINSISQQDLKLIGIALYWAEGYKSGTWNSVSFTNSDPNMIMLMMTWFRLICEVPEYKFRIRIQCYGLEKIKASQEYWSKITNIPISQFTKPYTRISPTSKGKVGNLAPYGICNIRISNVVLLTKIRGWINGLRALSSSLA